MPKIVYLPLDERPCNADFPTLLFGGEWHIVTPPQLGYKKAPADTAQLMAFLEKETADADGLVLSMDTLLYGGLIPSRLHYLSEKEVTSRLQWVRQLKQRRPELIIHAFQCIMRCPQYSSDDEEPPYYAEYGRELFLLGEARHRCQLGLCGPEEAERLAAAIPAEVVADFLGRRAFNLARNLETLQLMKDGVLDTLLFPQDDSAKYGFTAMDQAEVRAEMARLRVSARVLMYPGSDELGLTLMSRMTLRLAGKAPKVYLKWASVQGPQCIPLYEDRPVGETVKYHLIAAGCRLATSLSEADVVLGMPTFGRPAGDPLGTGMHGAGMAAERNLHEFLLFLQDALAQGKVVTIADTTYANASDPELMAFLDELGLLPRLQGYAGWNTSSNTTGTAVAMGVHAFLAGVTPAHRDFLALRYVEDACYCTHVRRQVMDEVLPELGLGYFHVDAIRGQVSREVATRLAACLAETLPSIAPHITLLDTWMPWQRMFEAGLKVKWNEAST